MGNVTNKSPHAALSQAVHRAEERSGRIGVEGRYHRLPRRLHDDYRLSSHVLGSGSNGCVVLAKHRRTGQKVAVKTFRLRLIAAEKRREFANEVEIFLCLDHPKVARLFEVYECEDYLSFVMECMEGGELYSRVAERKYFSEKDAAEATWQMLLAVNYLHSEGMVHRDLKLENFLYERQGGDYLKLIDFGFSRICKKSARMEMSCGTVSYVAPEVLSRNYGTQCDLWSLGVIVFVLLAGYMPFHGHSDYEILQSVRGGHYSMKPRAWAHISAKARDFVQRLLVVQPSERLTAESALEHPWIMDRCEELEIARVSSVDGSIANALMCFAKQTRFRRACMQLMAWSLSREEREQVRDAFLALDQHHTGVIKLTDLKQVLEYKFHVPEDSCQSVLSAFDGLDSDCDGEVHYSSFLAAMMSSRLVLHDELLRETFHRFDTHNEGYITRESFRQVLGDSREVDDAFAAVDYDHDGRITLEEFIAHLHEDGKAMGTDVGLAMHDVIDRELQRLASEPALVRSGCAPCGAWRFNAVWRSAAKGETSRRSVSSSRSNGSGGLFAPPPGAIGGS